MTKWWEKTVQSEKCKGKQSLVYPTDHDSDLFGPVCCVAHVRECPPRVVPQEGETGSPETEEKAVEYEIHAR
jgi:hypothetical protein